MTDEQPEQRPDNEVPATEVQQDTRAGLTKTADEKPKKKVAKRVVTPKRLYFFPDHNQSVEADTIGRATSIMKRSKRKDGDG